MSEPTDTSIQSLAETGNLTSSPVSFQPPRMETFSIPSGQEERLEWVAKSCERFFAKVREFEALSLGLPELN